ncbi:pantothenate synthetase [Bacteroidia bacterium]|nr:pantothenate synthetase [Bacteroidia bacterium]GHT03422.1 pantothenate synthetase [Bacteroidia bacterium]GHT45118.1 pantothenate synthetase [Bacteroidia bacterium]
MKLLKTVSELQANLAQERKKGKSIGFVPTMGALHQGHIELIKQSAAENDISVVSIFVNPTQFNDKNDLLKYPRTLDADYKLMHATGTTLVFAPSVEEIYPEPDTRQFGFGTLETVMEGQFRPGHFNGVAQVVSRLFDIVKPDRAYFGEKDFQQLAIIRALVKQLNLNIEIIAHPIVREPDGLALSSRNTRLTSDQRKNAVIISQTLFESKAKKESLPLTEIKQEVIEKINAVPEFQVEYFDLVDRDSLQTVKDWTDSEHIVGCIAAYAGNVRLIDNISYY